MKCTNNPNEVLRESCAECPNPPDVVGTTWCDGTGDCAIRNYKALTQDGHSLPSLPFDTCLSKYIFERSLVLRKVLNFVCFNLKEHGIIHIQWPA